MSRVRTGSFKVVDDTGREETVYVYTLYEEMTIDRDGRSGRTEVGKEYRLDNGNAVSVGADGQLVEVVTGRKLHRV